MPPFYSNTCSRDKSDSVVVAREKWRIPLLWGTVSTGLTVGGFETLAGARSSTTARRWRSLLNHRCPTLARLLNHRKRRARLHG